MLFVMLYFITTVETGMFVAGQSFVQLRRAAVAPAPIEKVSSNNNAAHCNESATQNATAELAVVQNGSISDHVIPASRRSTIFRRSSNTNTSVSGRKFSTFSLPKLAAPEFKFSHPGWLILCGCTYFIVSAFGFYLAFCQLLDSKSIDPIVMIADVEKARSLIANPEIDMPCINNYQSACSTQYAYSAFFAILACQSATYGCLVLFANSRFASDDNKRLSKFKFSEGRGQTQRGDRGSSKAITLNGSNRVPTQHGSNRAHTQQSLQVLPAGEPNQAYFAPRPSFWQLIKQGYRWSMDEYRKLHPLGELAWLGVLMALTIDIFFQSLRCFVVQDSYAVTSGPHTIAQIALMTSQVLLNSISFCIRSELGCEVINFLSEYAYLGLRLSLNGSLSMRSASFANFMIDLYTLYRVDADIYHIARFIKHAQREDEKANSNNNDNNDNPQQTSTHDMVDTDDQAWNDIASKAVSDAIERHRKKIIIVLVLGSATAGTVGLYIAITKWMEFSMQECNIFFDEFKNELNQGPMEHQCDAWQFNLYNEPACSCLYLRLGGLFCFPFTQDPDQTMWKPWAPYFQDAKFAALKLGWNCPLISDRQNDDCILKTCKMYNISVVEQSKNQRSPKVTVTACCHWSIHIAESSQNIITKILKLKSHALLNECSQMKFRMGWLNDDSPKAITLPSERRSSSVAVLKQVGSAAYKHVNWPSGILQIIQ